MDRTSLIAQIDDLKSRLRVAEDELAAIEGSPQRLAQELRASRRYACDASSATAVDDAVTNLSRYGFCVVEGVIPDAEVSAVRAEVEEAEVLINENIRRARHAHGQLKTHDQTAEPLPEPELRPARKPPYQHKLPNDIVYMPRYALHLAHRTTAAIAKRVLDDHLRIAQLHLRPIAATGKDGTPGGFGNVKMRGRADTRGWHTDWPHDLSAYGSGADVNVGCIRQPFPDVPMCLVMIWYLTDVDEDSGGTWVVPGSHRDPRNPRGPADGMNVTAPIPGDLQITAKAGSVYIQDSRAWHASAMHNTGGKRVAVVNRWAPWWLAVDDYAPGGWFDTVCRPLTEAEYTALPPSLQPYLRHCCPSVPDTLQQPVLDRAAAAEERNRWGQEQLRTRPEELGEDNAHINVVIKT